MSQVPPPPPPFQPQQPGYPPQPGYGAPPPPGPGGAYTMQPQRESNVAAIISLICGILGCVPILTGLLAIILGVVGLRKASKPNVGGKGMAIAGLILGVISVGAWSLFGGGMYKLWAYGEPARQAARQFAVDLGAGNVDAAAAKVTPSIKREQLVAVSDALKAAGGVQDTTMPVFKSETMNGQTKFALVGVAQLPNNKTTAYLVLLVKEGDAFKVDGFHLTDYGEAGSDPEAHLNKNR